MLSRQPMTTDMNGLPRFLRKRVKNRTIRDEMNSRLPRPTRRNSEQPLPKITLALQNPQMERHRMPWVPRRHVKFPDTTARATTMMMTTTTRRTASKWLCQPSCLTILVTPAQSVSTLSKMTMMSGAWHVATHFMHPVSTLGSLAVAHAARSAKQIIMFPSRARRVLKVPAKSMVPDTVETVGPENRSLRLSGLACPSLHG